MINFYFNQNLTENMELKYTVMKNLKKYNYLKQSF